MWQHINNARLTSIFQTQYRSFRYQKVSILDFTEAKDEEGGGNNFTGDVQSSSQIITTNKQTPIISTGRMPFLSPNQQCEIAEGKRCQQRQTFQHVKIECVCVCVCASGCSSPLCRVSIILCSKTTNCAAILTRQLCQNWLTSMQHVSCDSSTWRINLDFNQNH